MHKQKRKRIKAMPRTTCIFAKTFMNVLILGGGGREHTFCWKLAQSPLCKKIYTAPGNAGTEQLSMNLPLDPMDFKAVKQAVLEYQIEMVVVGPEAPLVVESMITLNRMKRFRRYSLLGHKKKQLL